MYKVDLPKDLKEVAAIARRRNAEEARKQRIFNPKERMFGKDYNALKMQIDEKRARECQERQRDLVYQQEMNRHDLMGVELERRLIEDRRRVRENLETYRAEFQKLEDRREHDLNDPNRLRKMYPARLHDEDPRCGPASLQRFEGEDLSFKERIQAQGMQGRAWWDAQLKEKRMNKEELDKATEIYDQRAREIDLRACQLWAAQREAERGVAICTARYNQLMAEEVCEKKELEKRAHDEAAMAHMVNVCSSELMTETVDATSVNGPHTVQRENFKGYSAERLAMIREEQKRQMLDKQRRLVEDRQFDLSWDQLKKCEALAGTLLEYEMQQRRKDNLRQEVYTNMQLARDQQLRQEYLNRILYTNNPTEEYYNQFNTTTR